MPDFTRSAPVAATPDAAFSYVADPRHLPDFVATMKHARPSRPGGLAVAAEVNRRREEGESTFRADARSRTILWGGFNAGYHGCLRVEPGAGSQAIVRIEIHTRDDSEAADVEAALDPTLETSRLAAGRAGVSPRDLTVSGRGSLASARSTPVVRAPNTRSIRARSAVDREPGASRMRRATTPHSSDQWAMGAPSDACAQ